MLARQGSFLLLAVAYVVLASVGASVGVTALKVFGMVMWVVAAGLFVYLMLFKGMRLSVFQKAPEASETVKEDEPLVETEKVSDSEIFDRL